MPRREPDRTVAFDPIRPKEVTTMKRILIACLLALMIVPSVASATYQMGDSPHAISTANGPRPAAPTPATPIVREVPQNADQTLPVVLASLALSVAVVGTGYVALRVRPMLRH